MDIPTESHVTTSPPPTPGDPTTTMPAEHAEQAVPLITAAESDLMAADEGAVEAKTEDDVRWDTWVAHAERPTLQLSLAKGASVWQVPMLHSGVLDQVIKSFVLSSDEIMETPPYFPQDRIWLHRRAQQLGLNHSSAPPVGSPETCTKKILTISKPGRWSWELRYNMPPPEPEFVAQDKVKRKEMRKRRKQLKRDKLELFERF